MSVSLWGVLGPCMVSGYLCGVFMSVSGCEESVGSLKRLSGHLWDLWGLCGVLWVSVGLYSVSVASLSLMNTG